MEIQVKDNNVLYQIKELVEKQDDQIDAQLRRLDETEKRVGALSKTDEETRAALKDAKDLAESVNARLDKLDKELPKGGKFYPGVGVSDADMSSTRRRQLGEMLVDQYRKAKGVEEKFGFFRDQQVKVDADGGYLVPEEQSREIFRLVSNFGFARKYCRIIPMTRQIMRLPVSTYGPTTLVGDGFGFSAGDAANSKEGAAGNEGSQVFTRPQLEAARLLAYDDLSLEVDEDSDPSLMAFLVDVFAEAIALTEDNQALSASVQPFTGVLYEANVGEVALAASQSGSFANITYDNIVDLYNAADEKAQDQGIFVMSTFAWNSLRKLKDTTNYPLMNINEPITGGVPMRLLGRPVVLSTKMPKASQQNKSGAPLIAYGDFSRYAIFGDRRSVSIDVSPHYKFINGQLVLRFMERFAFKIVLAQTFSRLKAA